MFVLSGVCKSYATTTALDAISLAVEPQRTTVLIGPSGCGKSTLIRLLVGLITPDDGEISFEGTPLSQANILLLRRRMGYVIQEGGLFPHMTARRNVALMARHLGWPSAQIQGRVRELAELMQLPLSTLDQLPIELSGGQRQRISLMRALMLDPDVLLLDEPLGALDSMIRYDLQQELRRIFQRLGKTVVLVTHDLAEASYLGDVMVLMRSGQIIQQGPPAELVQHPRDSFVERFIQAQRGLNVS